MFSKDPEPVRAKMGHVFLRLAHVGSSVGLSLFFSHQVVHNLSVSR